MDISFLWSNDLINVSVIAWVSAQLIKAVVDIVLFFISFQIQREFVYKKKA